MPKLNKPQKVLGECLPNLPYEVRMGLFALKCDRCLQAVSLTKRNHIRKHTIRIRHKDFSIEHRLCPNSGKLVTHVWRPFTNRLIELPLERPETYDNGCIPDWWRKV